MNQEQLVNEAFSRQAEDFDKYDTNNSILQWMRSRVREHVLKLWKPGEQVLEINSGTGLDAIYFAEKGILIHATENSEGMMEVLNKKIKESKYKDKINTERCSFLELENIKSGPYHHIFSNFGGLNCTDRLANVFKSFSSLLIPGGTVTLVIMPPFCLWEMMSLFKGNFKLAFRRWKRGGTESHLEGVNFTTWYYKPSKIKKMLGKEYSILSITGLGVTVPPPYRQEFAAKNPEVFHILISIEKTISDRYPFYSLGDHYIITAKLKPNS